MVLVCRLVLEPRNLGRLGREKDGGELVLPPSWGFVVLGLRPCNRPQWFLQGSSSWNQKKRTGEGRLVMDSLKFEYIAPWQDPSPSPPSSMYPSHVWYSNGRGHLPNVQEISILGMKLCPSQRRGHYFLKFQQSLTDKPTSTAPGSRSMRTLSVVYLWLVNHCSGPQLRGC